MKVAAWQAPLLGPGSTEIALDLIAERIAWCDTQGVRILCCPEGILGGLADYAPDPAAIAIAVHDGQLERVLAPLTHGEVAAIIGFTEIDAEGRLYNSAAVFESGAVIGVYRKLHPAINHSVYDAGDTIPVFSVGGLTFGINICRDSTFSGPATAMVAQGATALFVPTNNGLPPGKGGPELIGMARACDIARAIENRITVIRADVAGSAGILTSFGSTGIVGRDGAVLRSTRRLVPDIVVAEVGGP